MTTPKALNQGKRAARLMAKALKFLDNADTVNARAALRQANELLVLAKSDESQTRARADSYGMASTTTVLAMEILDEQTAIFQQTMKENGETGIGAALKAVEDSNMEAIVAVQEAQEHLNDAIKPDELGTAWMAGAGATMLIGLFIATFGMGGQTLIMGPADAGLINTDGWLAMGISAAGTTAALVTKQASKHDELAASGTTTTGVIFTVVLAVMAVASAL